MKRERAKYAVLNEEDVKRIEILLKNGLEAAVISEITGVSRTTVRRIQNGTHYLLRGDKPAERAEVAEETAAPEISDGDISDGETALLEDIVNNQRILIENTETIIQIFRRYLSEWRVN